MRRVRTDIPKPRAEVLDDGDRARPVTGVDETAEHVSHVDQPLR